MENKILLESIILLENKIYLLKFEKYSEEYFIYKSIQEKQQAKFSFKGGTNDLQNNTLALINTLLNI